MKKTNLIEIGLRIKQIRKKRKLSLQNLANRSELSKGFISKIENFRTFPPYMYYQK